MEIKMALFKDISDQAAYLAKTGARKVKKTGKIASLKLANHSAQEEIEKLYAKLGERYYKQHGLAPEKGFEKLCDKVTDLMTLINENEALATELKIDGVIDEVVAEPDDEN